MNPSKSKCIVLLSGGLDSTTVLAIAKKEFEIFALSFDYGQRHKFELQAAELIARNNSVHTFQMMTIDLKQFGHSALTDDIAVPKNQEIGDEIPITYVPVRNTIFLSYALAYAEVNDIYDIFIGVNALDYSGYPDCRPEYINAFQNMANLGTKFTQGDKKITIHTPLIDMTKSEIILKGSELGVSYQDTHSCYDPSSEGLACGECDACSLRKKGFNMSNIPDPTLYQ
ncbi:MAG: 7-cyano-7-deazaguanine synthase QueC [bacterium]|jgi:7-cyano-7-deazaguanine synthase|nr:7-cyano-7-deazaguanine synthase QueC [Candidatus Neomarinimicrobiota bacterium]HIL86079.1 7-cyano-7-deazaguanine synthase QueC [Candidatus Neomarinimicrobiota bacterium]